MSNKQTEAFMENLEEMKKEPTPTKALVHKPSVSESPEIVNDYNIDAFLEKRKQFITKVNKIMVEGKDYHVIQGKKSLAKGGAEKIASIFGWTATFAKDTDVMEAFAELKGNIAFVCTLTKGKIVIGEGRGAANLDRNAKDPNKTIKMAQKSAFIDAVLRTSGLSDFFTQDLEDMPREQISKPQTIQTPEVEFYCQTHDKPLILRPAGKTKQGVPYKAFWACNEKIDGKFCKGPFLNADGIRVRQNPETGEMQPDQVQEAEIVEESSVDKARRILNAKVPPNHGKDFPS